MFSSGLKTRTQRPDKCKYFPSSPAINPTKRFAADTKPTLRSFKKRYADKSWAPTHQNLDSFFHHQGGVIGGLTNSHHGGHAVLLQLLSGQRRQKEVAVKQLHALPGGLAAPSLTSMNLLRVAFVGLWVMRNRMFL